MEAVLADTREKDLLLSALGFNVNLSPMADVSTNPADFMYDRTFGQDAAATADYVAQVVSQMAEDGMGSVLKHFPGYGNNVDTHTGIAVDQRPLGVLHVLRLPPLPGGYGERRRKDRCAGLPQYHDCCGWRSPRLPVPEGPRPAADGPGL